MHCTCITSESSEKIMGLSLASGGHLTHGYKISFSGFYTKVFHMMLMKTDYLIMMLLKS
nr:hypothetical protein [Mycoplasmopsis caviae]